MDRFKKVAALTYRNIGYSKGWDDPTQHPQ